MKAKLILLLVLAMVVTAPVVSAAAANETVGINNGTALTGHAFQGIGAEVYPTLVLPSGTEQGFTAADFERFKVRAKKMNITFVRMWVQYDWFNPSNGIQTFESNRMKAVYKFLDFFQANGIDVMFQQMSTGDPTQLYPWLWWTTSDNAGPGSDPTKLDTWASNVKDVLNYIHTTKNYTCVKYVSLNNEANLFNVPPSGYNKLTYAELLYQTLADKLSASGVNYVSIVAPDVTGDSAYLSSFITDKPNVAGSYSYHQYGGINGFDPVSLINLKNTNDPNGKQKGMILAEFGDNSTTPTDRDTDFYHAIHNAKYVISALNAGWTGFSKWTLYDGFFDVAKANQTGTNLGSDDYNWGLWRSKDFGWTFRQNYYAYSLLTRFSQLGSTIYQATISNSNLYVAVLKSPGGDYTVMAVNTGTTGLTTDFNFSTAINKTLSRFSADSSLPVDPWGTLIQPSASFANVGATFTDTIPANSVAVYTSNWNPSGTTVGVASSLTATNGKTPAIDWTAAANAKYYRVYRDTNAGFTPSSINQVGETESNRFLDDTLDTTSTTYYYKVIAVGDNEQTGSVSSAAMLDHNYLFSTALSYASTDGDTAYTIRSDRYSGYTFKVNKVSGVGKFLADSQDVQKNNQSDYWTSIPRILSVDGAGTKTNLFQYDQQADSVSAPVVQADGSIVETVSKSGSTLTYQFYPDYIRITVSGNATGYHVEDVSYRGVDSATWADGSSSDLRPLPDYGSVSNTSSSLVLNQNNSHFGVKYTFTNPLPISVYKTAAARGGMKYVAFDLANNQSYTLSMSPIGQENLAAGRPVTTSSSVAGHGGSIVTDGSNGDFWSSQLLPSSAANEWAYVDLGAQRSFSKVVLYPRNLNGSTLAFPSAFKIQGSNDASTWTDLTSQTSFANPPGNTGAAFWVGNQSYRYVRFLATAARVDDSGTNYYVQLAEMEIYQDAVSTLKPVNISSTVNWSTAYGGSNVTDNTVSGSYFWSSQLLSSSAANEWAYVDLGAKQSFSKVVLYPRTVSGTTVSFPSAFQIQGSNDATIWTDLTTQSSFANPPANSGAAFWVGNQSYRYIRFLGTTARVDDSGTAYYVQLQEMEVER